MQAITSAMPSPPTVGSNPTRSLTDLQSDDFLALLITQLQNQDPLEPMGNKELLDQISSVRQIELSTTLTDSLRLLTGQQRFGSASTLIGQYVTGLPGEDGLSQQGLVVGVQFTPDGNPVLQLSNGSTLAMDKVQTIESPLRVAEQLVGQDVVGLDRRDPTDPKVVEGVVTAARSDPQGEILLELDSGKDLRFRDLVNSTATGQA